MPTATITLTETDMRNAALVDETFAEARSTDGAVRYWDATSDPAHPGWVLRTYSDGDYDENAE